MSRFLKLIVIVVCFMSQMAFAGAGLLFNVIPSGIAINIRTTAVNHFYPKAGIKINTAGYILKNAGIECTPNASGYCLFPVSDTQTASITIAGAAGSPSITLCLNGVDPYSCQLYTSPRSVPKFAYVTNGGNNTVSICALNSDGSLGTCTTSIGSGTFNFGGAGGGSGITLNTAHTYAYISNYNNNTVSICPVNASGTFGACTTSTGDGTFNQPDGSMAFNARNSLAYIPNCGNGTVSICTVNADGSIGTCSVANGNGTFVCPTQVAFNSAATLSYIGNQNNTISICPINNDGSFGTCTTSAGNGTFINTQGLDFSANENFLYVGNFISNTVSICPINLGGSLGTCTTSTGNGTFNFSLNEVVCVSMSSLLNIGYVPNNGTNTVSVCPLNPVIGEIETCVTSTGNGTFNQPSAITIG